MERSTQQHEQPATAVHIPAWPVYDPKIDSPLIAVAALWRMYHNGEWGHLAEFGITKEAHGAQLEAARRELAAAGAGSAWRYPLTRGTNRSLERLSIILRACPALLDASLLVLAAYYDATKVSRRAYLRARGAVQGVAVIDGWVITAPEPE